MRVNRKPPFEKEPMGRLEVREPIGSFVLEKANSSLNYKESIGILD